MMGILSRRKAGRSLERKISRGITNLSPEEMKEFLRRSKKLLEKDKRFKKVKEEKVFIKAADESKIAKDFGKFAKRINARITPKPTLESNTELLKEMITKEKEENRLMLEDAKQLVEKGVMKKEMFELIRKNLERDEKRNNEVLRNRLEAIKRKEQPLTREELEKERETILKRIEESEREMEISRENLRRSKNIRRKIR